jgi:hypothetical protein
MPDKEVKLYKENALSAKSVRFSEEENNPWSHELKDVFSPCKLDNVFIDSRLKNFYSSLMGQQSQRWSFPKKIQFTRSAGKLQLQKYLNHVSAT